MVSITFDEFHALRTRQRAETQAAATASAQQQEIRTASVSTTPSQRPGEQRLTIRRAVEARSSSINKTGGLGSVFYDGSEEDSDGKPTAGEVAPRSGSVSTQQGRKKCTVQL